MNKIGRFGEYGGQYVPEIVMNAVNELNEAYEIYKNDPEFQPNYVSYTEITQTVHLFYTTQRR